MGFKLKPWADRFLVLRADLLREETMDSGDSEGENERPHPVKDESAFCPIGGSNPCFGLERATSWATRRMGPATPRIVAAGLPFVKRGPGAALYYTSPRLALLRPTIRIAACPIRWP